MNILHVAPLSFNKYSGISVAVPNIISNQNKLEGINSALLISRNTNIEIIKTERKKWGFNIYEYSYCKLSNLSKLDPPFGNPDLIVFHSTYIPVHLPISKFYFKKNIPYIVVPHGGMTKYAQNKKRIKKKIGNFCFFNQIIKNSQFIQYLSQGEADASKHWKKKYSIVGNGIDLPDLSNRSIKKNTSELNFTFIGRLDIYNKGLDYLINACRLIKEVLHNNNVKVNIYGPDNFGNRQKLIQEIKNNELDEIIRVKGPVYDEKKVEVLLSTDVFILLSRSEGQPVAVLEALSYGIPCLLTPGTNMSDEIEKYKCGWRTEADEVQISKKIQYIVEEFSSYEKYKRNAEDFIKQNYSWMEISKLTVKEYKKIWLNNQF